MKNALTLCLLCLWSMAAFAQDGEFEERYVAGGSFNFFTQKNFLPSHLLINPTPISGVFSDGNAKVRWTTVRVQPYVGKEITSRLMLGLSALYGTENGTTERWVWPGTGTGTVISEAETVSQQFGLAVFSRHTLNPDQKIQLFLQPSAGYYFSTQTTEIDSDLDSERESYYINIDLSAGVLYNISQRWRATLRTGGLSYVYGQSKNKTNNTRYNFSSFGSDLRLSQLSFGLEMRF